VSRPSNLMPSVALSFSQYQSIYMQQMYVMSASLINVGAASPAPKACQDYVNHSHEGATVTAKGQSRL